MSTASTFHPFDRTNVLYNLQDWQSMLGEIVESNPAWADRLAQVMYETISTLQAPDRTQETIDTMKLGLEWIFSYTSTHALSFELFLYEAEGLLKETDCPEALIGGAMERAQAKETEELTDRGIEELGENGTRIKRMKMDLRRRSESGSLGLGERNAKPKRKKKQARKKT